jgi:hypothetical protein
MNQNLKKYKFKIQLWFHRNRLQITWFLIGWLVTSGISALFAGQYLSALISFLFAGLNYVLSE